MHGVLPVQDRLHLQGVLPVQNWLWRPVGCVLDLSVAGIGGAITSPQDGTRNGLGKMGLKCTVVGPVGENGARLQLAFSHPWRRQWGLPGGCVLPPPVVALVPGSDGARGLSCGFYRCGGW